MRDPEPGRDSVNELQDPIVAAYMPGIDLTLLRENLKLTPTQRVEALMGL